MTCLNTISTNTTTCGCIRCEINEYYAATSATSANHRPTSTEHLLAIREFMRQLCLPGPPAPFEWPSPRELASPVVSLLRRVMPRKRQPGRPSWARRSRGGD